VSALPNAGDPRALDWTADVWGRRIVDVARLTGGFTSTMLRLTAEDGSQAVLRLMTREPWRTHAAGLLRREAGVQALLAGTPVAAPTSLALDADGSRAGTPAHLMTLLPGSLELGRCDDDFLGRLAGLLGSIHAVDPGSDRPRTFQSWAPPAKRQLPQWSARPELWREAFALLETEPPAYDGRFLHRDFHLGNVLWDGDEPTGVVDWVETSWGPAALDVAHAATYLSMLHGVAAAERFVKLTGCEVPAYWQVLDVVGYLPDPVKVTAPWRDCGHHVPDRVAHERLEELLEQALG